MNLFRLLWFYHRVVVADCIVELSSTEIDTQGSVFVASQLEHALQVTFRGTRTRWNTLVWVEEDGFLAVPEACYFVMGTGNS